MPIRLIIEDDGIGMEQGPEQTGVGSRLIRAFAQQIGGTVTVTTRMGGGTVVTITFADPLFDQELLDAEAG